MIEPLAELADDRLALVGRKVFLMGRLDRREEVGLYKDPVSDYGRLSSELFRAVRLVVDTGIHDKGWTRDQVIAYMIENDVNKVLAQTETDRYIAWPGQALAYKMGQLKIRELRERARTQLGPRFDIKVFHDEILNGGPLPLGLLEERVDGWIKTQRQPQAAAVASWLSPSLPMLHQ